MAGIITTAGENRIAELVLKAHDTELRLFVNNYTPVDATVESDLTQMSTLGYAAKTLDKDDWVVSQVSSKAEAAYPEQTFTFTAGTLVTIYGYWIRDTDGTILVVEKFGTPHPVENDGDELLFTPKVRFSKE